MPRVAVNGIQIECEMFGNLSSRPFLLIIGLGGQLIQWDESLCRDFVSRGHYVIRYDNCDTGLSSKLDQAGEPKIMEALGKIMSGDKSVATYSIEDMADDGAGLLEALGIPAAHICGMSMGGMIAQELALRHPSRVLSLISIYSSTGNPELPQPKPEVLGALITPPPTEREANIEHMLSLFKMIAGPGFPFEENGLGKQCLAPKGCKTLYCLNNADESSRFSSFLCMIAVYLFTYRRVTTIISYLFTYLKYYSR